MDENSRLEFLAIPMTIVGIGIIALLVWAGNLGVWAWIVLGVIGLIVLIGVSYVALAKPHRPPAPAPGALPDGAVAPPDDGIRRVLVIAGDAPSSAELRSVLSGASTNAFVVAPVLGSRTSTLTGDDGDYEAASAHLEATLAALKELEVPASGRVGARDPLQAADDGLREFSAGEILFVVRPSGNTSWLEDGVVQQARDRYPIPVTELSPPGAA
jgi:GABA permease